MNTAPQCSEYVNPSYNSDLDDPASRAPKADQGVLIPNSKDVRFWSELFGKGDEEMNGRFTLVQPQAIEVVAPVESVEDDPVLMGSRPLTPSARPLPPSRTVTPTP